jgi:shikimate kinase
MPGCGKSSIGKMVGNLLQTDFYDLDAYIEEKAHTSIPDLFQRGEDHFRQLESNAVREIYQKEAIVISTGGGIVTRPENMQLLQKTGTIFYIERPLELILQSSDLTNRPLLAKDSNQIYTLHQQRKHLYEQYCHFRIINDHSLATAVDQISTIMLSNTVQSPPFLDLA